MVDTMTMDHNSVQFKTAPIITSAPTATTNPPPTAHQIQPTQQIPPKSFVIKTDKPRPHVCVTCTRSFARLEHLKRHERSHTKEKPFPCPVCERAFARRDLLLRHRQKLHASFPETPKVRATAKRKASVKNPPKSAAEKKTTTTPPVFVAQQSPLPMPTSMSPVEIPQTVIVGTLNLQEARPANGTNELGTYPYHQFVHPDHAINRMRSASFSAASAHSYAKVKDIADIDAAQPSDGPNQVGFATPQLYPINDFEVPFDEMLFNQPDAMFINPELLDSSFDNFLLVNNSSPDSNVAANGATQPHDSNSTLPLNFPEFNQTSFNPIPNSPPVLETDEWLDFNQVPIDPITMLNFDQFHAPTWQPQEPQQPPQPAVIPPRAFRVTPELCSHIASTLTMPTPFSADKSPFLPPMEDLQRYVDTYIKNFDSHFPFLHHSLQFTRENVSLALSMAAIGALYLSEPDVSENIFDISRCCVHVYLESRRERKQDQQLESTPIWLVQTLLLGVVYGLFNEEILANQIAVAQANAVISLAKSAGLQNPPNLPIPGLTSSVHEKWDYFIQVQERIRTMHVVHIISCLLATGYNVTSSLRNADLKCGSPCDEKLWAASTAEDWWLVLQKKESEGSLNNAIEGPDFTESLDRLLSGNTIVNEISQFMLLTLIYAIHLDIHQHRLEYGEGVDSTRWLDLEKRRVEAVLRAWETTWSLSPHASLIPRTEDGSLMSDSIPMSSLAHVRLYLDLRKAKECFWKRDFVAMGHELDKLQAPTIVDPITIKPLNTLLEAASYAADTISLWEKHVSRWTLHGTTKQTFIHNIIALFDCGLIVSEFFFRLEKRGEAQWANDERVLVGRLRKIFNRAFDALGMEDATRDTLHSQIECPADGNDSLGQRGSQRLGLEDTKFPLSVMALTAVSRILASLYIWPYAGVMSSALKARMAQINALG